MSARPLTTAVELLAAGEESKIQELLLRYPLLLEDRVETTSPPYNGYFCCATLLHHVTGNPAVTPLPENVLSITGMLLDHGAAIDAATVPGPDQPDDIGWSTLGLAATSGVANDAGVQLELVTLLLDRGADMDFRNGGPMMGALYYGQLDAAQLLAMRHARLDLVAAAGLGRSEIMARWLDAEGPLAADAHSLVHYSQVPLPTDESEAQMLALALIYASMGGHIDAARRLRERGAPIDASAPFDHGATPLHWAAYRGQVEMIELLLGWGASTSARDTSYGGTPQDWAEHADQRAAERILHGARS